jgi:hypothetical protein
VVFVLAFAPIYIKCSSTYLKKPDGFCFGVGKQELKFGAIQTTALFFPRSNVSRDIMRLRTGGTVGLG